MRSIFKLGLGLGLVSIAAWCVPACGGDSSSDDGKKTGGTGGGKDSGTGATGGTTGGTGGTTGGTGGTTGGTGGATGGTGGTTTMTCKSETCQGYNIANIVTLPPCCATPAKDKCGVDIDETVASQIGIEPGCFELNQAGNADPGCAGLTGLPLIGSLPGCCNAAKSKCSFTADLSGFGGPNIGCVDPDNLPATDAGPPASCIPGQPSDGGTTDGGGGTGGTTEAGTGGATTDAAADATTD